MADGSLVNVLTAPGDVTPAFLTSALQPSFPRAQVTWCRLEQVLAPARLATAVGMRPDLSAHPGAAWDVLFPRLLPDPGEAGFPGPDDGPGDRTTTPVPAAPARVRPWTDGQVSERL